MDYENLFHPHLSTQQMREGLIKSKLWPLVTGIVSLSANRLKVSKVYLNYQSDTGDVQPVALLTDSNGIHAFQLKIKDSQFELNTPLYGSGFGIAAFNPALRSRNVNQILSRVAEDRSSRTYGRGPRRKGDIRHIGDNLDEFLNRNQRVFIHNFSVLGGKLAREVRRAIPSNSYSYHEYEMMDLIDLVMANGTLTSDMQRTKDKLVNMRPTLEKNIREREELRMAALHNDKWAMYISGSGFVSVGKINLKDWVAASFFGERTDNDDVYKSINIIRPFQIYRSLNALDPEIAHEINARLTMDKAVLQHNHPDVFRNSYPEVNPNNLLPFDDLVDATIGYSTWTQGWSQEHPKWVMFDA
jgi:hypothetical protein